MFRISTSTYTPPGNGIGSYISHSSVSRDVIDRPGVSSFTTRTITSRNEACECHLGASGKVKSRPIDLETLYKIDFAAQILFSELRVDILGVKNDNVDVAVLMMDKPVFQSRRIDDPKLSEEIPDEEKPDEWYYQKHFEYANDITIYAACSTTATYIEIEQEKSSEKEKPFDVKKYFNAENREFLGEPLIISKELEVLIVCRGSKTDYSQPSSEIRRKINISEEIVGNKPFDLSHIAMRADKTAQVGVMFPSKETSDQTDSNAVSASAALQPEKQIPVASPTTTIHVKYDAGFGNTLFIRGEGPGMSWEQGIELKNTGRDSWCFEVNSNEFKNFAFKIVKNNQSFEEGSNHTIECGKEVVITPVFK